MFSGIGGLDLGMSRKLGSNTLLRQVSFRFAHLQARFLYATDYVATSAERGLAVCCACCRDVVLLNVV